MHTYSETVHIRVLAQQTQLHHLNWRKLRFHLKLVNNNKINQTSFTAKCLNISIWNNTLFPLINNKTPSCHHFPSPSLYAPYIWPTHKYRFSNFLGATSNFLVDKFTCIACPWKVSRFEEQAKGNLMKQGII